MLSRFSSRLLALAGALLLAGAGLALWLSVDRAEAVASTRLPPAALPSAGLVADTEAELAPSEPERKKSKEEQRFARADRDDDGRITQTEYLHQRRRNFDKLDVNGDGRLSFEEYAASGIARFRKADANSDGLLIAAEFATTAPKPRKMPSATAANCRCPTRSADASTAGEAED